ncbi:hypothetical protein DFH27DRAFT_609048 [Peziza echinospora]|nr:hypothetical protein DFH27DRAFT_609048 [Peziza echinospora]
MSRGLAIMVMMRTASSKPSRAPVIALGFGRLLQGAVRVNQALGEDLVGPAEQLPSQSPLPGSSFFPTSPSSPEALKTTTLSRGNTIHQAALHYGQPPTPLTSHDSQEGLIFYNTRYPSQGGFHPSAPQHPSQPVPHFTFFYACHHHPLSFHHPRQHCHSDLKLVLHYLYPDEPADAFELSSGPLFNPGPIASFSTPKPALTSAPTFTPGLLSSGPLFTLGPAAPFSTTDRH